MRSPPAAVLALLLFTADVAAAVVWHRALALWQQACRALAGGRRKDAEGAVAVAAA